MNVYLIDNDSDCIESLILLLEETATDVTVSNYQDIDLELANSSDLVVLSGGVWYPDPTDHAKHYQPEVEAILQINVSVLGVCLGMLLIAMAYGADTYDIELRRQGTVRVRLSDNAREIFDLDEVIVRENHTIAIDQPPRSFEELGRSDDGVEVIHHQTKPILGLQFHPELSGHESIADSQFWRSCLNILNIS